MDNLFKPYTRGDRPSQQGLGLGLHIASQIAQAHGGTLTAENIPGTKPGDIGGARFVVTSTYGVREIAGHKIGLGENGPVTKRLDEVFEAYVGDYIHRRMAANR